MQILDQGTPERPASLHHFGVEELDGINETLEQVIPGDGGGLNLLLAPGVEVWEGGAPVCTT